MLATKNRAGSYAVICVALASLLVGCTPAGPRALLDGKRLLDEGRSDLAIAKLKVATSLLQTNAQAWNYYGVACHRTGQHTNAVAAYQKALDLNRDLLEARYNLGCAWLDLNKPELAKAEFTSYTLRRGNAVDGWLKLGTAQLRTREAAAAEKSFREALRVEPKNAEALNGLGLVYVQRNRPQDAAQQFNAALKQQPGYGPALLNLATVTHQSLNDRATALAKYREYLALKPRPADWEKIQALVQSWEQPAAPASRPVTNLVVNTPATTKSNVAKVTLTNAVASAAPKTNAIAPPKQPESSASVRTNPAPPASKPVPPPTPPPTATVEVVTLPPEPVIRSAPETIPPSRIESNAPTSTKAATKTLPPANSKQDPSEERKNLLSRVNPANLFRRETKPGTNLAPAVESVPAGSKSSTSNLVTDATNATPPSVPSSAVSSGQRYSYLSPRKPVARDRREAERAFAQGQQAYRANRLPEAAQAYRQATQADPSYFEAHYNLGLVTYESRSFRQSLTAWENALAIQPESADARYNFALALKAANYPVDAANQLKQVLVANANETRAHLVLGNLFAEQFNDPVQARAHYLKVLEQDPRHPQATAIRFWLVAHPP